MSGNDKSAAQIEREIDQDRRRIEQRLGAIQERLSPGQMVDELLAYGKNHGGAEFATNFKRSVTGNPLAVTMVGVGLAWLMARPNGGPSIGRSDYSSSHDHSLTGADTDFSSSYYDDADDDYPLATVTGDVRRTGPFGMEGGDRYSYFEDTSGQRFKALTDERGNRAGHFMDSTGKTFRGFADSTGESISRIMDEAGNLLDEASGWASRTWRRAMRGAGSMQSRMSGAGRAIGRRATSSYGTMQDQSARMNDMVQSAFRSQPLIGGALAFAAGAAIGAALPRTAREEEMLGDAARKVRENLSSQAARAMDKGSEMASEVYASAATLASELHDTAKDRIVQEARRFDGNTAKTAENNAATSRPH